MMKKMSFVFIIALIGLLVLSACATSDEPDAGSGNQDSTGNEEQAPTGSDSQSAAPVKDRLSADFANALSPQGQLALGTLRLEESDLALDETAAGSLLPLWQALQSLSNSPTTAAVEIDAVVNQIQDSMTAEQIAAIAGMKLTEDILTTMFEEGELGRAGRGEGGESGVGAGFGGGGDFPGGRPGGGQGGGSGGDLGTLSEDDIATRRAEFAEGGTGDIQDRLLLGGVVRLLQEKSGQAPERGGIFDTVYTVISEEIGLSVEEIQAQTTDGTTLAEIVEANGGDLEAAKKLLIEAFNELPNAEDLDAEQMAAEWLGLSADSE
jgi:hypothetical protein